jgi:hypothetical protein
MTRASTDGAVQPGRPVSLQLTTLIVAATLPALVIGNGLDNCRTIADDRERLACYDTVAGNTPKATAPTATINAESLFGRDAAQTSAVLQQQTGITPPQILDAEISSVETRTDGKLRLSLHNDQRWEQVDGRPLDLVPGDQVRIRKAAFGSYLLYRQAGGRSIRVRRVD